VLDNANRAPPTMKSADAWIFVSATCIVFGLAETMQLKTRYFGKQVVDDGLRRGAGIGPIILVVKSPSRGSLPLPT